MNRLDQFRKIKVPKGSGPPHVRGDDVGVAWHFIDDNGPPPRAWGRPPLDLPVVPLRRSTPTCVGTTWAAGRPWPGWSVHPHVRGDDAFTRAQSAAVNGPPPRAWGRRRTCCCDRRAHRSTPTCVGTTPGSVCRCATVSVHPHVRGDDGQVVAQPGIGLRSTPTCVGTTKPIEKFATAATVHPHVRGDDERSAGGSPAAFRSTPTCVGTTLSINAAFVRTPGPPPRAWGRRPMPMVTRSARRSTPTCVGTTPRARPQRGTAPVHPHVRGDDAYEQKMLTGAVGPPPRAWGRREWRPPGSRQPRSTPTCVGTTL